MNLGPMDALHLKNCLEAVFTSPNVLDVNGEDANMVDVLDRVDSAIYAQAERVGEVAKALNRIADALHNRNDTTP